MYNFKKELIRTMYVQIAYLTFNFIQKFNYNYF